ncbi:hypothetical protein E2562_004975 [Oryza meyeriana var. granulata]|uniref:BHLH domain-containing protein n=1 Tax=Oryza meyeriana var. granulata TaxID=110450 RepID=A0A6G1C4A7_9ORYZ|nr:hypothetical protein E2562_004975 [Oryza meyeriana var. granulata]
MSSRRSRPSSSSSRLAAAAAPPRPSDEQIAELISKLQAVLPTCGEANGKVSSAEVLQEACRYIRRLNREADALSERLADLLLQPSDRAIDGADASELIA